MKKALLWIVGSLVSLWVVLWVAAMVAERSYARKDWPDGLGRVADVPSRYPETKMAASAAKLMSLSAVVGINITPKRDPNEPSPVDDTILENAKKDLSDWSAVQLAKTSGEIEAPPPPLAAYLTTYGSQLDLVRDHLLRGDELAWPSNLSLGAAAPIPNLLGHMQLSRVFVARSLEKSRAGDATAWDELHAAWNLNRGLWKKPTLIEILIALATTRMMNGAAGKAPGVEPLWYSEVRSVDSRRAMLAAHQAEAWIMGKSVEDILYAEQGANPNRVVKWFTRVLAGSYLRLSGVNTAEHMRLMTVDAAALTQCDLDGGVFPQKHYDSIPRWNIVGRIAMPNLETAWQRLMRYQVELEATDRIQQIRRGQTPAATSRCSDGSWQFATAADGTRTLRFSRDIPVPAPGVKYPLQYTEAPVTGASK